MRIAYLVAGTGWTYCGACARDQTLLRGLSASGHEVQAIPLYLPIRQEESQGYVGERIFYGGLTTSLQQILGGRIALPGILQRWLDHPRLLRWVSRFAVEVNPARLGPMTVSMLAGADGRQRKELEQLLQHLESLRPDLVHLTNTLLSGLAPAICARLKVPVVAVFQGEDSFVAALPEPHRSIAGQLIRENLRHVGLVIIPCQAGRETIGDFLGVGPEKMRVVRTGLEVRSYLRAQRRPEGPFTIAYLSAIKPEKGLDLLVEAVRRLVQDQGRQVTMAVAGQVLNRRYWQSVQRQIRMAGLERHFQYAGELDFAQKVIFFHNCDVLVLPSRIPEWRGLAVMEAMAAGVPVVVPQSGVFPELLAHGGGTLFSPENVGELARVLAELMDHPPERARLGQSAAATIARHYTAENMVRETVRVYEDLLKL